MSQNPFGSASPASLSNNPFIDDSSSAHNRYPALNNVAESAPPSGSYGSPSYGSPAASLGFQSPQPSGMYSVQSSFGGYSQPTFGQPQIRPLGLQPTGYFGSPVPSPTSAFGSPYSTSPYGGPSASPYGYMLQQQQQQQPWAPQPTNRAAPHIQDLDPYSGSSPQSWTGPAQQQSSQQVMSYASAGPVGSGVDASRLPSQAEEHPRTWIRSHKAELETWDPTSWKQALLRFADLQTHWERRKDDIQARVDAAQRGFIAPQELPHWQALLRDAVVNIDTVAASRFQMEEALTGYKQSSDFASKRRVKEFLNAGLLSLPDWPPPM